MTNINNDIKLVDEIMRKQNAGEITREEASAQFDKITDDRTGCLHFYGDTTRMRDTWDKQQVMVIPQENNRGPSNVGLICQGPDRGKFVRRPGSKDDGKPWPVTLAYFKKLIGDDV